MTHKLAYTWTTHVMPPLPGRGLIREGHMDLSTMDDNGILANGTFYLESGGSPRTLKGEAIGGNPVYYLTLREYDDRNILRATYDGLLAHESANGRMVIVGKKHFPITASNLDAVTADQNDPPWVLTKP